MAERRSAQTERPKLSIVVPAYCEARRIGTTLDELAHFLGHNEFFKRIRAEVLVVAADAPDRTHEIIREKQALFGQRHIPFSLLEPGAHVGKGRDVRYGVSRAQGNIVLYMDADLATPLHHMEQFYTSCRDGADVVIGTRNLLVYRTNPLRNLFSRFGNMLYQLAGGLRVEDTQCGFKMFSQEAAQLCFSKLSLLGWGFDLEVLAIAKANGLTVRAYRIDDWEDKPNSTYTDGPARIAIRSVRDLVHIDINKLRGVYKA